MTATGYLAISRRFGFDSENYHHLTIQDTIDTLGQSVLGLSLGCARCHDHKFDALSMRDYYALYGIFDSSRYAFPGSEQKAKVRSLAPLRAAARIAAEVAGVRTARGRARPGWPDKSSRCRRRCSVRCNDIDGDFELQAPAAGGSNGVLVSAVAVRGQDRRDERGAKSVQESATPLGKVGASVPADAGPYRIAQALYPRRARNCDSAARESRFPRLPLAMPARRARIASRWATRRQRQPWKC